MIGLRNSDRYCSLSAFAPIVAPTQVPWGQKAFSAYLGEDKSLWSRYDTINLLNEAQSTPPMLVDVGTADPFTKNNYNLNYLMKCASVNAIISH